MTNKRNPQFNVRIPPELKEKVVALAEKNKRSVNAEIVAAIELSLMLQNDSESVVEKSSGLVGGIGHSLKFMKAAELEKFVNLVAKSSAEKAVAEILKKK